MRALFPMDEKNLSIVFCGTQGGLRTTALKKSMYNKKIFDF